MSGLTIERHQGDLYLPELGLWLDPHKSRKGADRVFVSHAHHDHTGRHREVILTGPTARLMDVRLGGKRVQHVLSHGEVREFMTEGRRWRLVLLPAGHILGSAMALVETDESSLLYTGDFKLRPGLLAAECEPRRAEFLVMETTFGRPEYRFPPSRQVLGEVVGFCRATLEAGAVPVLLAYALGKSQELLCGLKDAGMPIQVSDDILRLNSIHEEFGQRLAPCQAWKGDAPAGTVVICAPGTGALSGLRAEGKVRVAAVTGWALDRGARYRMRCDEVFPLSDHADYGELLELVDRVAPRRIYTVHGFATEFAATLRGLGHDARVLGEVEQLTLPLGITPGAPRRAIPRTSERS